ncbi:MAG: 3-deoxy-D-manno-octulosonic acid transferase [Chlorobiaceae bacterium]|nr:3-deoxy-D-manno-octulosonic acid transferase [Chlorobiaceae bacterium]
MPSLALIAYRLSSPLQPTVLRLLSSRFPKLKTLEKVRINLFPELEKKLNALPKSSCRLWVHASSVGEFEQARPIITELRKTIPGMDLVVSFFSESGYEARKNYPDAAAVFYLPVDTPENAKKLASLIGANIFLLMRYDFWPNHLEAIKKSGAKMVLAAATLPAGSPYLKRSLKGFYRQLFSLFDLILTISDKDRKAFRDRFGCQNVQRAGDPRFDQVVERKNNSAEQASKLKPLFQGRMVLVGGSTWEPDESILVPAWLTQQKRLSLVLVPHQVDRQNIERLINDLRKKNIDAVTISSIPENFNPETQVLVVDQTGYLAELYSIASIAYVGGAFGVNVHNTIEPAAHSIPVLLGPRYSNSPEATGLVEAAGGIVVNNEQDLRNELTGLMENAGYRRRTGHIAVAYVRSKLGATSIITKALAQYCPTKS